MVAPTARAKGTALHRPNGTRAAHRAGEPSRSCRDGELTRPRRDAILADRLRYAAKGTCDHGTFYGRDRSRSAGRTIGPDSSSNTSAARNRMRTQRFQPCKVLLKSWISPVN